MPTPVRDDRQLLHRLVAIFAELGGEQYIRSYRQCLRELIESDRYVQDEGRSYDAFIAQAEQVRSLYEEVGLGVISLSSILFYPPYSCGAISDKEITALCPDGTLDLIGKLHETHELYAKYDLRREEQGEEFLLSIAQDIRVVLILLIECYSCLVHAKERMSEEERVLRSQEAEVLFVPIAHRLGLYKIKSALEDLIFKYTDPDNYYMLKERMGETLSARKAYMEQFLVPIYERLGNPPLKWPYQIKARSKTFRSIMNKIRNKGVSFDEIHDFSAMRIIIDAPLEEEYEACWQVYSIVTDIYEPNIKRLRDWISQPKANGYESLQITVKGPQGRSVEVQIRTVRMDLIAESGMAAHWRYKGLEAQSTLDSQLTSMRQVVEELSSGTNREAQISLRMESRDIFAFTPAGKMIRLPKGATVLDFAFAIHSNVGITAQAARVNSQRAKLRDKIKNGDVIEIITAKHQKPSVDWLQYVSTRKAKNKIRQAIREQQERGLQAAKELLERRFKNRRLTYDESLFSALVRQMGYKGNMDFFIDLSEERVNVAHFLDQYAEAMEAPEPQTAEPKPGATKTDRKPTTTDREDEVIIVSTNLKGLEYTLASCCNPKVGDSIFAYPSKSGLKIHTRSCPNAIDILGRHGDRVLPASWSGMQGGEESVQLYASAVYNPETVARILTLCRQASGCHLLSEEQHTDADSLWHGSFLLTAADRQDLYALLAQVQAIKGVQQASLSL